MGGTRKDKDTKDTKDILTGLSAEEEAANKLREKMKGAEAIFGEQTQIAPKPIAERSSRERRGPEVEETVNKTVTQVDPKAADAAPRKRSSGASEEQPLKEEDLQQTRKRSP